MTEFNTRGDRGPEMAVRVKRARTGKTEGVVSQAQLERYGWGRNPLGAVAAYREALDIPDEVELHVCSDEESHYPSYIFQFDAAIQMRTTRPQKVLREIAHFLLELSNDPNAVVPDHLAGRYELNRLDATEEPN